MDYSDEELLALGLGDAAGNDEPQEQFLAFIRWMLDHGATVEELQQAARRGLNDLFALRDQLLYLGPATLSVQDIATRLEVSVEDVESWWRLLRLPAPDDGRFTEADVVLLWTARFYSQMLSANHAADALRILGGGMQQITTGLRDVWRIAVPPPPEGAGTALQYSLIAEAMADDARRQLPAFLFSLYWRHTAAAVADNPVSVANYATAEAEITVLFVDLVDFTRLAQRVDATELTALVSAFELTANEIAHQFGGRLVKMLGDGAMFHFASSAQAVRAAMAFVSGHPELPPRRAAVATGRAVSRSGDFFGPVVNLAARLASVAGVGEVVVDLEPSGVDADQIEPVALKGYDEPVTPFRVRLN